MSINSSVFMGRLTADPELRHTGKGTPVTSFTIAVNGTKNNEADFIPCVAWKGTAELISRYFRKGRMIAVQGAMKSSKREINGKQITVIECHIREVSFTGEKVMPDSSPYSIDTDNHGDFEEIIEDDDLPF